MSRCRSCVLPIDEYVEHEDGMCLACKAYMPPSANQKPSFDAGRAEVEELVRSFRGKGKNYDVLVPLTGGKDSMFALHMLAQFEPRPRMAAFTVENGFTHKQALANIQGGLKATGVPHIIYDYGQSDGAGARLYGGLFRLFGTPCVGCRLLLPLVVPLGAIDAGAPLIISASTGGQGGVDLKRGLVNEKRSIRPYFEFFSRILRMVARRSMSEGGEQFVGDLDRLKTHLDRPEQEWPSSLVLGTYVDWNVNEEKVVQSLADDFGFEKPQPLIGHTSCHLSPLRGHLETKRRHLYGKRGSILEQMKRMFGVGRLEAEVSEYVRTGLLTRAEGLRELEALGVIGPPPVAIIEDFCRGAGLSLDEFKTYSSQRLPKLNSDWLRVSYYYLSSLLGAGGRSAA